jgi:peptidoglycan/LPS O-acetylase OafA/YrhL
VGSDRRTHADIDRDVYHGSRKIGVDMERIERVRELDSMRGLAAIAIVVYHLWLIQISVLGAAVDLFFVLSGYLITSILLAHPPSERFLLAFYARRALRIWPIYYLSLLFLVAINPWTSVPGSLDGLPYFLTFTQGLPYYWQDTAPAFITAFRHTWSLAIEEQFYIVWPALICLVGKKGLPWAAIALICLAVSTRTLNMNSWILITHCDGLALGALLAGWLHAPARAATRDRDRVWLFRLALGSAVYWVVSAMGLKGTALASTPELVRAIQSTRMLSLNVVFFALVGLTVLYAGHPGLRALRDRRLVYFGQISYGLYLYHHIVFVLWDDYASKHGLSHHIGFDLVKLGVSLAISALSYRYLERPILTLKDLFPYRPATVRTADPKGELAPIRGMEPG